MTRIPFQWTQADGFVNVAGTMWIDGPDLVLSLSRKVLELVPLDDDTFRIPAAEIESVEVQKTAFRCRLVVRVMAPEVLDGFPGNPGDEVVLPIARRHAAAADELARALRLRNLPF